MSYQESTSICHTICLENTWRTKVLNVVSLKGKHTNKLSLRFVDPDLETRYSVEKEKQSGAAFSCSCVVLLFTATMEALIDPWSVYCSSPCDFWPLAETPREKAKENFSYISVMWGEMGP